jgi:hypothetical protein
LNYFAPKTPCLSEPWFWRIMQTLPVPKNTPVHA